MIDDDLTRKLGEAGVDIGAMGIQWGKRPDKLPTCSIQDRDLRLLRFLHDFNYASTSTLAAMFWGSYGSAVRERLKLLHDVGFVDKLRPRVGRTQGAPEWVYRLTLRGWQLLRDQGEPADREAFKPAKLTSIAYVEHDVQVAALMAQIAARAATFVGKTGPLSGRLGVLEQIVSELAVFYPPHRIHDWLFAAHRLLGDELPAERIRAGRGTDVLALIARLRDGAFS